MMKELLIRTGKSLVNPEVTQVRIVFSDGFTIEELEAIKEHLEFIISQKRCLQPKGRI